MKGRCAFASCDGYGQTSATGNKQYREVIVQTRRLTIGRASDQHLQIADPKVFPNHAVIRPAAAAKARWWSKRSRRRRDRERPQRASSLS